MTSCVVAGAGVPHVPVFPQLVHDGDQDVAGRYETVATALAAAEPDLVVVVANDHLNAYFLDRLPTFAISLGAAASGPMDAVPTVPSHDVPVDDAASAALAARLVDAGFDLTLCRDAVLDHSVVVPLYFLNGHRLPVVVLHVNGFVAPLPSARRCNDLGQALCRAVSALPGDRRVAVLASGSFSQEVGGSRVDAGRSWSVPRSDWAGQVAAMLAAGDVDQLVRRSTPRMLADAGSVAGEVLSWITVAGAVGRELVPDVDYRAGEAFAFVSWTKE